MSYMCIKYRNIISIMFIMNVVPSRHVSIFSTNSETFALELLENIEVMIFRFW